MNHAALSIQLHRIINIISMKYGYFCDFDDIELICGINILTYIVAISYFCFMNQKHINLQKAGLFNKNHKKVNDSRFTQESTFFDPCDNLQVRYEMLRSHIFEGDNVSSVCRRFGVTRQTFYTLQEKLNKDGSVGLLQKKTGPQGPTKLNETVMAFINQRVTKEEPISAAQLCNEITMEFGLSLHKRTVEKIIRNLRIKKNFASKE
jgi:transposase